MSDDEGDIVMTELSELIVFSSRGDDDSDAFN